MWDGDDRERRTLRWFLALRVLPREPMTVGSAAAFGFAVAVSMMAWRSWFYGLQGPDVWWRVLHVPVTLTALVGALALFNDARTRR